MAILEALKTNMLNLKGYRVRPSEILSYWQNKDSEIIIQFCNTSEEKYYSFSNPMASDEALKILDDYFDLNNWR